MLDTVRIFTENYQNQNRLQKCTKNGSKRPTDGLFVPWTLCLAKPTLNLFRIVAAATCGEDVAPPTSQYLSAVYCAEQIPPGDPIKGN
jgi:hypothetical protein